MNRRPTILKLTAIAAASILAIAAIGCSGKPIFIDELIITDTVVGDGKESVSGKSVSLHYTGWVYDWTQKDGHGTRFDSSHDRGIPYTFTPGDGHTIKGWEQGVPGMKIGGQRELIIPAAMAYGDRVAGKGKIPANSDLIFELELIVVRR